jgi:hypothetical protein
MDKKKKIQSKNFQSSPNTPVKTETPAMVTEVVEETAGNPEKSQDEYELDTTKTVEEVIDNQNSTSGISRDDKETQETADKSKEVVEELFSKPGSGGLSEISINNKKSVKPLFWWAVVVIVAALTTGLSLIFLTTKSSGIKLISVKPTPIPTSAPTPTSAPVPNRGEIKIQVLNGGGLPGAASKMKNFLVEKGYQVTDVGNTDEYTYDQTEVEVKTGMENLAEQIKADLSGDYTVGKTGTALSADAAYDASVIVGKE